MAKYCKTVEVEAYTFEELVEFGLTVADNIVDGMPWSFFINGCPVTQENDDLYLIAAHDGRMVKFPRGSVLVLEADSGPLVFTAEDFDVIHECLD